MNAALLITLSCCVLFFCNDLMAPVWRISATNCSNKLSSGWKHVFSFHLEFAQNFEGNLARDQTAHQLSLDSDFNITRSWLINRSMSHCQWGPAHFQLVQRAQGKTETLISLMWNKQKLSKRCQKTVFTCDPIGHSEKLCGGRWVFRAFNPGITGMSTCVSLTCESKRSSVSMQNTKHFFLSFFNQCILYVNFPHLFYI